MQKWWNKIWLLLLSATAYGQEPFQHEIEAFRRQDSLLAPARKPIVFTGSSSFRMWQDVQQAFPQYSIINRGFGGSTFKDVMRHTPDVVFKYKPKQVVLYCGDNDLASSQNITADSVTERFKTWFGWVRKELPKTSIVFVSIKPSPSRARLMPEIEKANAQIRDFLSTQKRTAYVDIYSPMLGADGRPRPELFLQDSLHMNAQGYAIWKEKLAPVLKR